MANAPTFSLDRHFVSAGRIEGQDADYQKDCAALTPAQRLGVVQYLRECYWGNDAISSRFHGFSDGDERRTR